MTKDPSTVEVATNANIELVRKFKLTFDLDGGEGKKELFVEVNKDYPVVDTPTKAGYVFVGWEPNFPMKVTADQRFKALWKKKRKHYNEIDICPNGDHSPSQYDGKCESLIHTGSVVTGSVVTGSVVTGSVVTGSVVTGSVVTGSVVTGSVVTGSVVTGSVVTGSVVTGSVVTGSVVTGSVIIGDQKFLPAKDEQLQAYNRAYQQGITTLSGEARLKDEITRAELAKMMSVYVTKVLGKQLVLTGVAQYPDVDLKMGDLADYIQLAYELQIMGIHHDGTALARFEPNKLVTRAESATVFSRVLYGAKYNQDGENFFEKHLEALKAANILKDTIPSMKEMRGWVMLMLMRAEVLK